MVLIISFYAGFEKQKELTMMNTMQVRKEAISIMKKLKGIFVFTLLSLAFQNGEAVNMYPFLALSGPRGSGKSYDPFKNNSVNNLLV